MAALPYSSAEAPPPGGTVTLQNSTSVGTHLLRGQRLNIVNDVVLKGHRNDHAFKHRIIQVQEEGGEPLRMSQLSQLIVTAMDLLPACESGEKGEHRAEKKGPG